MALLNKLVSYLQDSRQEFKRVNWPTRNETVRLTLIVIGISLLIAIFLGASDFLFRYLLRMFIE